MAPRLDLHAILVAILGSNNVYFQPPPTVQLRYPCIIYKRDDVQTEYANDKPYTRTKRYQITVIDPNPDSVIHEAVGELSLSSYDRFFTADNLNHDVYRLFF